MPKKNKQTPLKRELIISQKNILAASELTEILTEFNEDGLKVLRELNRYSSPVDISVLSRTIKDDNELNKALQDLLANELIHEIAFSYGTITEKTYHNKVLRVYEPTQKGYELSNYLSAARNIAKRLGE